MNSGVVIHAICKRINIIVPQIGTVNQLKNKDLIFHYSYESPKEHLEKLIEIVRLAKDEYHNNFEKFQSRANALYEEVINNQTPEVLSKSIKELLI